MSHESIVVVVVSGGDVADVLSVARVNNDFGIAKKVGYVSNFALIS